MVRINTISYPGVRFADLKNKASEKTCIVFNLIFFPNGGRVSSITNRLARPATFMQ